MKRSYFVRMALLRCQREIELGRQLTLAEQNEVKTQAMQECFVEASRELAREAESPES